MAYSSFNYISPTELPTYIHTMSGVTDEALAATFISDAERVIDAFIGPAPRFYADLTVQVAAVASGATTVVSTTFGSRRPNYWAQGGVYLEVLDVPDAPASSLIGEKRLIVASQSGQVTVATAFGDAVPVNTLMMIHQESKFPRAWDSDPLATPRLPEELKVAVAYQVEYGIHFGSEEFGLGDSNISTGEEDEIQSRTYGSGYSESKRSPVAMVDARMGIARWVAPKARMILRGLLQATGRL